MHTDRPDEVLTERTGGEQKERRAVLTPAHVDTDIKRVIRAAAALQGLYDDRAIGRAVGRTGITVGRWWMGQQPDGRTLYALAEAIGLDANELARFVYENGPPPTLRYVPAPPAPPLEEALHWARSVDSASPRPVVRPRTHRE